MRALVVDDSKPVRHIIGQMLRELDFDVSEASNGREALDRLGDEGTPDIATVNWHMPEMDGLDFVRNVRADARYPDFPILMISSEAEPSRMATALAAGANAYIVKPCTRRTLTQHLQSFGLPAGAAAPRAQPTLTGKATARPDTRIRVMIVDDSVVVRRVVASVLEDDPELEVAGTAADGQVALNRLKEWQPDVVLLDVEMPNLNGLQTLQQLRPSHPHLPVIMFSSLTERGASVTTDALLLGADDYVAKPGGTHMRDVTAGKVTIREQLIPKIKQLSLRLRQRVCATPARGAAPATPAPLPAVGKIDLVAIAVSTGGPCALAKVVPACAVACPVPVVIVQHMPPLFTKHLADRLSDGGKLDVREGVDGESLRPGQVRIAPGGYHMRVAGTADRPQLELSQDPPVNGCRPSADILFQSVASVYGSAALAVVLTGMGSDGLLGCKRLRQAGAQILAQDEATSVVWGMPGQVARAGLANGIFPVEQIGPEIARRVRQRRSQHDALDPRI